MRHSTVIEKIYENESFSFFERLSIAFHLLRCKRCIRDLARYENAREIMRGEFFADEGESVADYVMSMIGKEERAVVPNPLADLPPEILPIRNWIVSGVIIISALTTSFFGMDFNSLVHDFGNNFTIPLAITIGTVITAYIALFIGKHLKKLSELFGLTVND
ncbi:MAG: hypothetical protein LBK61_11385 [Spirochaetaceae bacterium]|jgi:hypothetical protein|nr:hypothetical protein [Spirochaetaceae bacterium]